MKNQEIYQLIATAVGQRLGSRSFMTIPRAELTREARRIADDPGRKVNGSGMESALNREGLHTYPSLRDGLSVNFRVIRSGTLASSVVDLVASPSSTNDKKLGHLIKKFKNEWNCGCCARKQTGNHNRPL